MMIGLRRDPSMRARGDGAEHATRRLALLVLVGLVGASITVMGTNSSAEPAGMMKRLATGKLRPTVVNVNGVAKRLPFLSGSRIASAEQAFQGGAVTSERAAPGSPGISVNSLGCSD